MKSIDFTKDFNKQFEKLPIKQQKRARTAVELFLQEPPASSLRIHSLKGDWLGYRSISAGGDLRLHFKNIDADSILFVAIGTHSQLYK